MTATMTKRAYTSRQRLTLVATSLDGSVFRIDPTTGTATTIGNLGGGLRSSGDLVSVDTYGTLVTVRGWPDNGPWMREFVRLVRGATSL